MQQHPRRQGLYDPANEHDACGVAFVVDMHGRRTRDMVDKGIAALVHLEHRGASGAEANTGDGAGILLQVPDRFFREVVDFELPPEGSYATGMAFVPQGMTFALEGDANDYFGKGLSGGKLAVFPSPLSSFPSEKNMIIGNVALYGATKGEVFVRGMAGERFAVRNSGVDTVVEAVGDHGCEYMTGGRVVVLGPTGRNFAAGMSGGIAYLLDEDGEAVSRINAQMVEIGRVEDAKEAEELRALIEKHVAATGSEHARGILAAWPTKLPKFVRVIPKDYKRVLACLKRAHDQGLSGDEAIMAAFEENARDLSRVGGN